jgi:cytochrome c
MPIKLIALTFALLASGCTLFRTDPQVQAGRAAIQRYGCATCHTIPGIPGARGLVGPSLERVASRVYLAGVLENTPANMARWIQDPRAIDRLTAMPVLGVTSQEANEIVSYLYTLR